MKSFKQKIFQLQFLRTKVLFIFIYGTLVEGILLNYTLDQGFFYTGAISFSYIERIATELDYDFVLINNFVDLGTESLPRVLFYEAHKLMVRTFEVEGIHLSSVYIATVKKLSNTGIEILSRYLSKSYYRSLSFVIGDNIILLTKPVVSQYLCMNKFNGGVTAQQPFSWKIIYKLLKFCFSECCYRRNSKETDIQIFIKIDGKGISYINSGFGFFDHMLDQICIHANIDLVLKVKGDLHIEEHHSIEDTAIALGYALTRYLKDKRGLARYGFLLPMDDALVQVSLDLGGRSNLAWKACFEREKIGDIPTEMFSHFFKSFSDVAYCNLHINAEGNNEHHKIEAIFKAFSCAIKMAITRKSTNDRLPSSKEIL